MTVLQCLPVGTLAETADQGETVQENAEEPFGKDVIPDEKRGQKQHSEVTVESVVGAYRTMHRWMKTVITSLIRTDFTI